VDQLTIVALKAAYAGDGVKLTGTAVGMSIETCQSQRYQEQFFHKVIFFQLVLF
jgi:hypothetical protein